MVLNDQRQDADYPHPWLCQSSRLILTKRCFTGELNLSTPARADAKPL